MFYAFRGFSITRKKNKARTILLRQYSIFELQIRPIHAKMPNHT